MGSPALGTKLEALLGRQGEATCRFKSRAGSDLIFPSANTGGAAGVDQPATGTVPSGGPSLLLPKQHISTNLAADGPFSVQAIHGDAECIVSRQRPLAEAVGRNQLDRLARLPY